MSARARPQICGSTPDISRRVPRRPQFHDVSWKTLKDLLRFIVMSCKFIKFPELGMRQTSNSHMTGSFRTNQISSGPAGRRRSGTRTPGPLPPRPRAKHLRCRRFRAGHRRTSVVHKVLKRNAKRTLAGRALSANEAPGFSQGPALLQEHYLPVGTNRECSSITVPPQKAGRVDAGAPL